MGKEAAAFINEESLSKLAELIEAKLAERKGSDWLLSRRSWVQIPPGAPHSQAGRLPDQNARYVSLSSTTSASNALPYRPEGLEVTTLTDAINAYRICAQSEGRSPKTIKWITTSISYFMAFLGGDQDIASITLNDVRRFAIYLQSATKYAHHRLNQPQQGHLSPQTVETYLRAIRAFFGHLYDEELIKDNPIAKIKMPKVSKKVVPTFNAEEVTRLLEAPNRNTFTGFRDYTIMLTLVDTGIRLSELSDLKDADVDLNNGMLRVMGKGGKERYVPFGHRVAKTLLKYQMKRPTRVGTDRYWLTREGEILNQRRIEKIISRYGQIVGLDRCYPHKLRHTSSVLYLRNGGDPFSLQKKLGHSSLTMTRHYSNLADSDVKDKHMKFGVVDRLKW